MYVMFPGRTDSGLSFNISDRSTSGTSPSVDTPASIAGHRHQAILVFSGHGSTDSSNESGGEGLETRVHGYARFSSNPSGTPTSRIE